MFTQLPVCGHWICSKCLKDNVQAQINSKNRCIVKCPIEYCRCKLNNHKYFEKMGLFNKQCINGYKKKLDRHYSFIRKDQKCPNCWSDSCPKCHLKRHDGHSCEENKKHKNRIKIIRELEKEGKKFLQDETKQFHYAKRRFNTLLNGQVYGEGEYFSQFVSVSKDYCRGGNKLFLVYVLKSNEHKLKSFNDGRVCVINNPIDWEMSYCLPIFVVTMRNEEE
ncbi:RBR-type E3 ubiquitin transferase [Entamoeba marina]